MVIFLYFTSLLNNEKLLRLSSSTNKYVIVLIFIIIIYFPFNQINNSLNSINFNFLELFLVANACLVVYLLATLFVVVKLSQSFKGTLERRFF